MAVNMLVSFAFFADQDLGAYRAAMPCGRLMVDSGAFTASSTGKPVALPAYADFLERWRGAIDHAVTLDVIGDPTATRRNTKWLHDRGHQVLPVFTRGDRLAEFDAMVRDTGYVCVGGGVGMPSRVVVPRLAGLQHRAEELGGGIHALGLGTMTGLRQVRPYSADNSTVSASFLYGGLVYYDGRQLRSVSHTARRRMAQHLTEFKDAGLAGDVAGIMRTGRMPAKATRSRLMRGMVLAGAAADEDAACWGVPGIGKGDTGGSHLYMAITGDELASATASVDRDLHDPSWKAPPLWARYAAQHERQCRKLRVVPAVGA